MTVPGVLSGVLKNICWIVIIVLIAGLAAEFGVIMYQRVQVETQKIRITELEQERNLIAQDAAKMKREQEEREKILAEYEAYIDKLNAAKTVQEYIKIWKELDRK